MRWRSQWNKQLGTMPDGKLAARLGVHQRTVTYHRSALGIAAHGRDKIDRAGQRFGRWTILRELRRVGKGNNPVLECRCDCGKTAEVHLRNMMSGASTQCKRCGWDSFIKYKVGSIVNGQKIVAVSKDRIATVRCGACGYQRTRGTACSLGSNASCPRCRNGKPRLTDAYGRMFELDGETHNLAGWAKKVGVTREAMRLRVGRLSLREALTAAKHPGGHRSRAA